MKIAGEGVTTSKIPPGTSSCPNDGCGSLPRNPRDVSLPTTSQELVAVIKHENRRQVFSGAQELLEASNVGQVEVARSEPVCGGCPTLVQEPLKMQEERSLAKPWSSIKHE